MALVWCDGFTGYGNANNTAPSPSTVFADKYATTNEINYLRTMTTARTDGWALLVNSSTLSQGYFITDDIVSGNTCIAGVAHFAKNDAPTYDDTRWPLLAFRNTDGDANVELMGGGGYYWVCGPNRTLLGCIRVSSVKSKYKYVEMKVYSHASAGTVEVRVNGCPVFIRTGIDTLYASTKATTQVAIGGPYDAKANYLAQVDDCYVCDGTGSDNNDFLGPIAIETLWAASDSSVNFANTGNANYSTHYQQVIREARDETTDYVEDATTGNADIFTMDTSPTYDTVMGVVVWGAVEYETATANYRFSLESSNITTYSSNTVCPASAEIHPLIVENDPSTNTAFTSSALDSILCGIEVIA